MAPKLLRALLDDPGSVGLNEVVCACCAPAQVVAGGCTAAANYRCEAAGRSFAARFEATDGQSSPSESDQAEEAEVGEDYTTGKGQDKSSGGYLKISDLLKGVNLYNLMGISEGASQDEIKKAYRGLALTAHPDKQAAMKPDEAKQVQENFVKIQEAYELLSDQSKRKQYDSSLDFDESLPKFRPDSGQDFFQVFGEVFRRNARFSMKRPVPELGSLEEFVRGFAVPDSSRNLSQDEPRVWKRMAFNHGEIQLDPYKHGSQHIQPGNGVRHAICDEVMLAQKAGEEICDLEEAECREESSGGLGLGPGHAVSTHWEALDDEGEPACLAESFDPRIQAEKEAKRLAREAETARREEERMAAKRAKEEAERQQREAEEALRLAEEQKRKEEKAKREAVKERVKKCRQRLRSFHPAVKDHVVLEQLNEVCLQFSEEQLRELGNQIEETLKESSPLAAANIFHKAIESIGLTPMKVSEDTASTTSGPTDSQEEAPNQRESSEERRRAKENQAKMRIVEEQQAAEKARLAAERAEEKKKKEEQRRKDAAAAEAARRQQEKKEELKAKKAEEKQKKQEDEEKARKEQQRELAKQKAQEQAQKDRQAAQAEKEKLELERLINLFAKDRLDRLAKLEPLSDEKLAASLQTETEDSSLAGALLMVKDKLVTCEDSDSDPLERAIALVSEAAGGRGVWPLALTAPAHLRLENALRNRVKKARNRLREAVSSFLKSSKLPNADQNAVTEWQRGIVDGTLELPPWSPQESEPKAAGTEKKKKEKPVEEDLDQILAEFDSSPPKSKKPGKKKK
ncbi:Dnajc2 [Symbiodinium sp. CCMP2456]|nr:Dnajc2 [Symbiodinium sp. CCMP2456]